MKPKTATSGATSTGEGASPRDIPSPKAAQAVLLRAQDYTNEAIGKALGVGVRQVQRLIGSVPEIAATEPTSGLDAPRPPEPAPVSPEPPRARDGRYRRRRPEGGRILRLDPPDLLGRDYRPGDTTEDGRVVLSSTRIGATRTAPDGITEYTAINAYFDEQQERQARAKAIEAGARYVQYPDGSVEEL